MLEYWLIYIIIYDKMNFLIMNNGIYGLVVIRLEIKTMLV